MASSYYRQQLEDYLKTLEVNYPSVVDVGGAQKPVKGRTKTWNVKEYDIIDKDDYDLDVLQKDCIKKYDAIFCLEVFEYLIEPVVAMKNLSNLMINGGYLLATFQFVYPVHNEIEFDSLRYTLSGVKRISEKADLKIKKVIERKAKTPTLVKYFSEDGMRSAKGINHSVTGYIVEFTK